MSAFILMSEVKVICMLVSCLGLRLRVSQLKGMAGNYLILIAYVVVIQFDVFVC